MEVGQNCRSHTPLTPPTAISLPPRCIQGLICMVIVNTVKQQQTLSSYDQTGQYGYQSPCNMFVQSDITLVYFLFILL
ncbi:hypothetical protein L798_12917 [Zootermopsis nevadensis]|uniref:Uncharacterized protein n=1 Tax=Zootermopsis nevadensis TaxID=136037 RepID=A0A067RSS1_ZOONE|nr:hypothetical protein L798_12917 [Zootermopsis nevadensis]